MSESENRKRKLTPFLAHEMLFDFATDNLDSDRRQAVEEFVKNDRESQNLLEAIRRGIEYTKKMRGIELTESALNELHQAENLVSMSRRMARWSEWPDSLRWSIVALLVSICTAGAVVIIPWSSVPLFRSTVSQGLSNDSSWVEVAQVDSKRSGADRLDQASSNEEDDSSQHADQTGPEESSGDEEFSDQQVANVDHATQASQAAQVPQAPPMPPVVQAPKPIEKTATAAAEETATKQSRGFVYRAFMTLADLDGVSPKITQQIKELGAERAGEVELGWRRGTGRYYHFSIATANEQKLLEVLRSYGLVRISKDPHPRVMPEGQVRFILWIEAGT